VIAAPVGSPARVKRPARRPKLQAHRPAAGTREPVLVGHLLWRADPLRGRHRAGEGGPPVTVRGHRAGRRRLGRPLLRARQARRRRWPLDPNRPRLRLGSATSASTGRRPPRSTGAGGRETSPRTA